MRRQRPVSHLILCALMLTAASAAFAQIKPGRDPNQPLDDEYTRKIREYTTEPFFLSRSEEHTSELQSRQYLVCRLLLEKKKNKIIESIIHTLYNHDYITSCF